MSMRSSRIVDILLLLACVGAASAVSIAMGQDANWDLQNYHYYSPWAWWAGRSLDRDVAAAQLQTFLNPLLDLPFYAMIARDWDPRVVSAVLALPVGVGGWLLAKLAWLLFDGDDAPSRMIATAAALAIGMTAAMAVGTLGTTMNDWPGATLTLAALFVVARGVTAHEALPARTLIAAGLLMGIASGLKLTVATFAMGLGAAILLRPGASRRLRDAFVFGLAVLAGFAISYGFWGWTLWSHFGNPIFPHANEWIASPWWEQRPALERYYGPRALGHWLEFPLRLREPRLFYVSEVPYTDARIPALYVLAIFAALGAPTVRAMRARGDPPPAPSRTASAWALVGVFWAASFLLWTAQYSILRYIVALEILTGVLIVGLLRLLVRRGHAQALMVVAAVALIHTTHWPDWGRVSYGARWFDVEVPRIEPGALVLLVADAPMAYVLPFFPADARHMGVRNNINFPGSPTLLEKKIADAIRTHQGPLYSLSYPAGQAAADLTAYGLQRTSGGCAEVRTNMRTSPIELCRLERTGDPTR
jgi:hypothetical protein